MHTLMISLDPSLLQADSAARRRHAELARRTGSLTILVRAKSGSTSILRDTTGENTLTLIPFVAASPAAIVQRALAVLRHVTRPVDLIVTQDMLLSAVIGVVAARRMSNSAGERPPLLVQSHTTLFDNPAWIAESPLQRRLLQRIAAWVLHRADGVRTVNAHEQAAIVRRGFPAERVECLPLGTASRAFVDPSQNLIDAARHEVGLQADNRVLLWVGQPLSVKRVTLLFPILKRVLAEIPTARLVLIGIQPDQAARLRPFIAAENADERVILHAPVPHDQLPAYYALADVYVLPSSYEGLPRVLFEAGAAGIPTVAFDVPGVNEIIQDGVNGWLAPDGDLDAFTSAVCRALTDRRLAQAVGQNARRIAFERYGADEYPDRWAALWRRAVERGRRSKGRL